jgi:tRNA A37 threonylcarbamoyladenosine synthetase subunit TsaC/SUA5/YrdC
MPAIPIHLSNATLDAARVVDTVADGGVAVFPVDVGYAIVGNHEAAIARIFAAKRRSFDKACGMFSNRDMFVALAAAGERELAIVDAVTQKHRLPFSVVVPYRTAHPFFAGLTPLTRERSSRGETIDMLLNAGPLHDEVARLSWERGVPVLGSSANTSLSGSKYRLSDVESQVREEADLVIDGGDTKYAHPAGMGSTIIALPGLKPIRRGIAFDNICDIIRDEFGTDPRHFG